MRLRWIGAINVVRRVTGPDGQAYEWSERAGMVQDVDEETALELLTAPGEHFEAVPPPAPPARREEAGGAEPLEKTKDEEA